MLRIGHNKERIVMEDYREEGEVKICLHCKSIWIHKKGMNYCGDCSRSSFEKTHDDNYKIAKNYPMTTYNKEVIK